MSDLIDSRMRQIDHEAKNLDFNRDDAEVSQVVSHAVPAAPVNNNHQGNAVKLPSSAKACKTKAGQTEKQGEKIWGGFGSTLM
jgi:hypothetical protein